MVKFSKVIALASLGLLSSAAANAVEPGAFYAKGDMQYIYFGSPKVETTVNKVAKITKYGRMSGMGGNLGFGYNVSDDMRSDVTIGLQTGKKKLDGRTVSSKNLNLMVNGYYDFNNSTKFTPFVFAGLGVARTSSSIKFAPATLGIAPEVSGDGITSPFKSKTKMKLAYKLGAGFAVEMLPSTYLDITYGFENKKNPKYKVVSDSKLDVATSVTSSYRHSVSAGVRISF